MGPPGAVVQDISSVNYPFENMLSNHVKELVQGVIEGETRVLAASTTMEEIFKGTKEFKEEVFEKVQFELNQLGLLMYNANVKQLVDMLGHGNFSYLGQKTQQEAANQAKIDVAVAKMKGEIGAKESAKGHGLKQGQGNKEEIKVKAEVKVYKTQRDAKVAAANAELANKAWWTREAKVVEVEAAKVVALREAELQRNVEIMNAQTRTEKLKAEFVEIL
ncbi:hypothetical protein CDL15_Pgr012708 [Punica granatum]|uniref:Flotillin-like n=1 Tax=Punica granatum TaxID=22663 RepID=A0A218XE50_PUNGR|nr:hypothetical protein CDL15_Pgr012708 [Punica granatum]